MLRLLIVAPCDRDDVGEAWVAYQWVSRLAARHEVTLLTYYKRGSQPPSEQLPGVRVVEWAEPALVGRAERMNSLLKPGYLPFYLRCRRWIKRALLAGERFDLAHQPVPVAMRYPSPLAGMGIPYVIGPVGGSLTSPPGFNAEETAPWYLRLRALDEVRINHDPLLRRTYEDASCVLGIAPYVSDFLAGRRLRRFELMSETALENMPAAVTRHATDGPVRLLFVGRVIRSKGVRDAVRAMASLRDCNVRLDVVGDGFDRASCEQLSAELDLSGRVTFHGAKPRHEVDAFYRDADVFVFPSYREPGGNVAFEAMGAGLPLIVNDRGGPGAVVDESCGLRLTAENPVQYAQSIADAVRTLLDPAVRARLGMGSRTRLARIGLWDSKVDQMDAIYSQLIDPAARS